MQRQVEHVQAIGLRSGFTVWWTDVLCVAFSPALLNQDAAQQMLRYAQHTGRDHVLITFRVGADRVLNARACSWHAQ